MEPIDFVKEKSQILATLQDTISAGKAEKKKEAELRRKSDLDLIRRKKWEPEGAKNPLKVFPKEIWTQILDHLSTAEDIKSTSETCTLFQRILEGKYLNLYLVPEVFALKEFRSRWNNTGRQLSSTSECAWRNHSELRKLRLRETLQLREVSGEWRRLVDSYFEERIREFGWGSTSGSLDFEGMLRACRVEELGGSSIALGVANAEDDDLEEEETRLLPSKFSPRYLCLDLRDLESINWMRHLTLHRFLFTTAPRLLEAVGEQILRFDVNFDPFSMSEYGTDGTVSLSQGYHQLRSLIKKMPGIEWLKVRFGDDGRYLIEEEDVDDLQQCIEKNPFPKLQNLRKLELHRSDNNCRVETLIITTILENNQHVTDVTFGSDWINFFGDEEGLLVPIMNQVNQMKLEYLAISSNLRVFPELQTSWPLKNLKIEVASTNLCNLFRSLKNFPTLERLELEFSTVKCKHPGFLRLPNVTHFTYSLKAVYVERSQRQMERKKEAALKLFSVDFIFFMRKLEFFGWYNQPEYPYNPPKTEWNPESVQRNEIIQFKEGTMDLHDSNIWDVMPSLKTVEVESIFRGDKKRRVFKRNSGVDGKDGEANNGSGDDGEEANDSSGDGEANHSSDDGSRLIWNYIGLNYHAYDFQDYIECDSEDDKVEQATPEGSLSKGGSPSN